MIEAPCSPAKSGTKSGTGNAHAIAVQFSSSFVSTASDFALIEAKMA
jgi:hypothetical protein